MPSVNQLIKKCRIVKRKRTKVLSLAGCPPLLVFFAKYEVLSSLINSFLFGIAFLVVITITISCARYLTLINESISTKRSSSIMNSKKIDLISSYLISTLTSLSIFSFFKPLSSLYLFSSSLLLVSTV